MNQGVVLWKIGTDTETYVAEDPNGVGAKLSGGRWNHIGKSVVYVAVSRALACLETLVHLKGGSTLPFNRYLVQVTVPKKLWNKATVLDPQNLAGWDALPRGKVSMDWGTQWLDDGKTAIARVPSIIVPEENCVLINPLHRDASQIDYTKVRRWNYDPRLYTSCDDSFDLGKIIEQLGGRQHT